MNEAREGFKKREPRRGPYGFYCSLLVIIFVLVSLCFSRQVSAQDNDDYEELVQRNLEFRQKLKVLEEKYVALENERNVLIIHIRNLQEEKDRLIRLGGAAREGEASGDELKAAFGEVSKELGLVAKERDQWKKESLRLKEAQLKSEAAIKALEAEKAKLNEEIGQMQSKPQVNSGTGTAADGSLEAEKVNLTDQMARLKESFEAEKAALLVQQEEAVARAKALAIEEHQETFPKDRKGVVARHKESTKKTDEEKAALVVQLKKLEGENKKISEESARALKEIQSESQVTIKALEEKAQALAKQLAMEEVLYQTKREEWESQYQALVSEQEALKADSLVLVENNKMFIKKSEEWVQEKKTLEEKIRQVQGESKGLMEDFQQKRESWHKEIKASLTEKKQLRKRVDRLDKAERWAKEESDRLKSEIKEFQGRIKDLEDGLKASYLARKEYESLIQKVTAENSALRAKLTQCSLARERKYPFSMGKKPTATQEDKQRLDMHFNLAVTYNKTGMYAQEEKEYLECLKIDPEDAHVHYNLAILYDDQLNDNTKALKHYQKYLSLRPVGGDAENVKQWMLYAEEEARLSSQPH